MSICLAQRMAEDTKPCREYDTFKISELFFQKFSIVALPLRNQKKKKTMIYNVCVKKILYLLVKKSFGIDQVIFSG